MVVQKTNMDTQNDGLEKVSSFKHGNMWYQFVRFLGCIQVEMSTGTGTSFCTGATSSRSLLFTQSHDVPLSHR